MGSCRNHTPDICRGFRSKESCQISEDTPLQLIAHKGKGFAQIRNIPDSFIAADDIEFGFGNKIPLWIFGFMY